MTDRKEGEVSERVIALEHSNQASHGEMMRFLEKLHQEIKDIRDDIKEDLRDNNEKYTEVLQGFAVVKERTAGTEKEITRVDNKIDKVFKAMGAISVAMVTGVISVLVKVILGK